MKKKILAMLLACSSVFAFDIGVFTIDTEIGGNVNYSQFKLNVDGEGDFKNDKKLTYGAYGRVWLGAMGILVAPQVKWEYLKSDLKVDGDKTLDFTLQNMQYGGVLGYRIPLINLTPYVGVSYSQFIGGDIVGIKPKDTYAINFGAMWKIPFVPISLGFDGSYQKPKMKANDRGVKDLEILNLGATVGIIF